MTACLQLLGSFILVCCRCFFWCLLLLLMPLLLRLVCCRCSCSWPKLFYFINYLLLMGVAKSSGVGGFLGFGSRLPGSMASCTDQVRGPNFRPMPPYLHFLSQPTLLPACRFITGHGTLALLSVSPRPDQHLNLYPRLERRKEGLSCCSIVLVLSLSPLSPKCSEARVNPALIGFWFLGG